MFYDLTTIGDADCLVFIPRLAKWKVCYLVNTIYKKQLVQKTVITENVNHMKSVIKLIKEIDMVLKIKLIDVTT